MEEDTTKKFRYAVIPVIYNSPETQWAVGASAAISFKNFFFTDTTTRRSVVQAVALFSQRNQVALVLESTIFFKNEKYFLTTHLSNTTWPDRFWGIGGKTPDVTKVLTGDKTDYSFQQTYFTPHLKIKLSQKSKHKMFVGLIYRGQWVYDILYDKNSLLDSSKVLGKDKNHFISGGGLSFSYDTRNATNWPTRGVFAQSTFVFYNEKIGSTFNKLTFDFDFRFYKQIYSNTILAFQFYNVLNIGQISIRELAMIGGANNLRGYYQGRYRDNNMYSFILEYRVPIVKDFALVGFAGCGNVYNEKFDVFETPLKYSFGGGARYSVLSKDQLNLRLDCGFADKNNFGIYLTVAECF